MRVFVLKEIDREFRRQAITDPMLCEAIERAERGLIDANLGGHVIKQRLARPKQGKSGGFRTVIAYEVKKRSLFMYVFAKNEKDNISDKDLERLRGLASWALSRTDAQIELLLTSGEWREVLCDGKKKV